MPKRPASGWGKYKWPKLDPKDTEWSSKNRTNAVSHLHHEMKAVNIWLVFIRL